MSILSVCREIAERVKHIYDKGRKDGKEAERARFWEDFYEYQLIYKKGYIFAGSGWNEKTFTSDRTVSLETVATSTPTCLFGYCSFESFPAFLSDGVTPSIDTSGFTVLNSIFANTPRLTEVRAPLDISACTDMSYAFAGSRKLAHITLQHVDKVKKWNSAFNGCDALFDIGQEEDDFGYFSASVDLSQTAIRFDTNKMAIFSFVGSQYGVWLKVLGDNDVEQTLTISSAQYQQTVDYALSVGAPEDYANEHFRNTVEMLNWKLIVT